MSFNSNTFNVVIAIRFNSSNGKRRSLYCLGESNEDGWNRLTYRTSDVWEKKYFKFSRISLLKRKM